MSQLFNGVTNIKYSASSCWKFCNCSAGNFENLFLRLGKKFFSGSGDKYSLILSAEQHAWLRFTKFEYLKNGLEF